MEVFTESVVQRAYNGLNGIYQSAVDIEKRAADIGCIGMQNCLLSSILMINPFVAHKCLINHHYTRAKRRTHW